MNSLSLLFCIQSPEERVARKDRALTFQQEQSSWFINPLVIYIMQNQITQSKWMSKRDFSNKQIYSLAFSRMLLISAKEEWRKEGRKWIGNQNTFT